MLLCWTRVASRIIDIARACNPKAFVVFDSVDVNHVREYRHARVSGNAQILRRALATKARELECVSRADCTLATTEVDADALRAACPAARVEVVTLQAPPIPALPEPPWSSRGGSLFLGNLQAAANVDAALHLVNDILPELRRMGEIRGSRWSAAHPPQSSLGSPSTPMSPSPATLRIWPRCSPRIGCSSARCASAPV